MLLTLSAVALSVIPSEIQMLLDAKGAGFLHMALYTQFIGFVFVRQQVFSEKAVRRSTVLLKGKRETTLMVLITGSSLANCVSCCFRLSHCPRRNSYYYGIMDCKTLVL